MQKTGDKTIQENRHVTCRPGLNHSVEPQMFLSGRKRSTWEYKPEIRSRGLQAQSIWSHEPNREESDDPQKSFVVC
jgi:hypothetical protein